MTERKRQNAELRKPAILKAFYAVIESEGFENASIAKVGEKANVNPSLIIHYFGSKERMVMALVDDVLKTYAKLFEEIPRDKSPEEQLKNLLNLLWSAQWHDAASFSVVFSFLALSQRNDDVSSRVLRLYARFKTFLTEQLTRFAEKGIIRTGNPAASAEVLMAMCEGSHYFSQFFISPGAARSHKDNMVAAAMAVLNAPLSKRAEANLPD